MTSLVTTSLVGGSVAIRGALDIERTPHGVLPHRLPAAARAQFPDNHAAKFDGQPMAKNLLRLDATLEVTSVSTWFSGKRTCAPFLARHILTTPGRYRMFPTVSSGKRRPALVNRRQPNHGGAPVPAHPAAGQTIGAPSYEKPDEKEFKTVSATIVQYRTHPEAAEENLRLIEAVISEVSKAGPGIQYPAFRLEDGVTFVHVAALNAAEVIGLAVQNTSVAG